MVDTKKTCLRCNEVKLTSEFSKRTRAKDGVANWCKSCHSAYAKKHYDDNKSIYKLNNSEYVDRHRVEIQQYKTEWFQENKERISSAEKDKHKTNPARRRVNNLKYLYGLKESEYLDLLIKQSGLCAICHKELPDSPHVDHCHSSNKVRGLLCAKCNLGLGLFDDSPALFSAAIDYLNQHQESLV